MLFRGADIALVWRDLAAMLATGDEIRLLGDARQLAKVSPAKPSSIMTHVEASATAGPVEGKVAVQKPAVGKPAKGIPALSALN